MENIEEEIENKVIDSIIANVSGRLIVFKPEKSLLGEDLVVEKKGAYKKTRNIFLKIGSFAGPPKSEDLKEYILPDNFTKDENLFLVFVYFDNVVQKIGNDLWVVPSLKFDKNAGKETLSKFLVKKDDLGMHIMNLL